MFEQFVPHVLLCCFSVESRVCSIKAFAAQDTRQGSFVSGLSNMKGFVKQVHRRSFGIMAMRCSNSIKRTRSSLAALMTDNRSQRAEVQQAEGKKAARGEGGREGGRGQRLDLLAAQRAGLPLERNGERS